MNKRNTLRRMLALLCCMAMLLPCVPAAVAAEDSTLYFDDFESYADDAAVAASWKKGGKTTVNTPKLGDKAFSGSKSILMEDTEDDKNFQAAHMVSTNAPEGTEIIMSARYYVEELSGAFPRINMYTDKSTFFSTYSTGKWDTISGIVVTNKDNQGVNALVLSDTAPVSKTYWDDIKVSVLTEELAVEYINEKIMIPVSGKGPEMMLALESKALGLKGVDSSAGQQYLLALQAMREEKGAPLTKTDIENCVANIGMDALAEDIEGGVLSIGATGEISANVVDLPAGVTAKWVSVSPAGKAISMSGGKATATAIPTGADDIYQAVLRLSTANKSKDVNYTIRLVNAAGLDVEEVNSAKAELITNTVIGVASTGTVDVPKVGVKGVNVKWDRIKTDPTGCASVDNGKLTVKSIPTGVDYYEATAVLKLTKGAAAAEVEYSIVVYNEKYRTLLPMVNPSIEQLERNGSPTGWTLLTTSKGSYGEASTKEARTGEYSFHMVDTADTERFGYKSEKTISPARAGYEYILTYWAKGTTTSTDPTRAGISDYLEYNNNKGGKITQTEGVAIATNPDDWTLISQWGVAPANTAYIDHMPYSFVSTVCDVYMDDFLTWEITPEGSALRTDELLTGGDVEMLYKRLGITSMGMPDLNADYKTAYMNNLVARREAKGSPLTAAELVAGVKEVNTKVAGETKAMLNKLANQVSTLQNITKIGAIALPQVDNSTVTVKYTGVSGSGASRVRLTGTGATVDSLPSYGSKDEKVTLILTLAKDGTSVDVAITVNLKAYTRHVNDMYYAAQSLKINEYLNGQDAGCITSDLKELPASMSGGISIKWQVLDSTTLKASKYMTAKGKVTRPAYGEPDAPVTLRATMTKSGETYEYDLHLIVAAEGTEEARTMVTRNTGFEDDTPADKFTAPDGWHKGIKWEDGASQLKTSYANVVDTAFTGKQALRLTGGQTNITSKGTNIRTANIMNSAVTTAREGYTYTLDVMAYCDSDTAIPAIIIKFWDNFGMLISDVKTTYPSAPGGTGVWKNLRATGVAPAGTIMITAELEGGIPAGQSIFDNVRLREWAPVSNGSFDLGTQGWTTAGKVTDGKLTLTAGQTAVSMVRGANRGVAYYLSMEADGGKAALRFVDKDGKTLAEYSNDATKAFYAYAPANTAGVQVVLTGAMTVDNVKITRSSNGTNIVDGDFEISAKAGVGTPWDLTDAAISATAGKTGAGAIVNADGKIQSNYFPVERGKTYEITADVKGKGATMTINMYNFLGKWLDERIVTADGDGWTTLSIRFDQLPEGIDGSNPETHYAQLVFSGAAVVDNVNVYSVTKNVSNYTVEDIKMLPYGTFPYNWSSYGTAATYVANQPGQYSHGVKSLAVEMYGIGEGGVRSSYLQDIKGGKAYEAVVMAKGSGAKLMVEFWDQNFNKLGSEFVTIDSADFKEYSVKGTAPNGTIYASLAVGGDGTGLVYVDEASLNPVVRTIGNNVQTFIDGWFVADSSNVKHTLYEGESMGTDIMSPHGGYANIHWDPYDKIYKMWHRAGEALKIRTSEDLINWTDAAPCYDKATGQEMKVGGYVHIDEDEPNASKRYKGMFWVTGGGRANSVYAYFTSADGIYWTQEFDENGEAYGTIGMDVHTMIYDPINDEYVMTHKNHTNAAYDNSGMKRDHRISVSKDLMNWTVGSRQYTVGTPMDTVEMDVIRTDGYGNGMYPMGDSYVSVNWRTLLDQDESFGGQLDLNMLFSRDLTESWQRLVGEDGKAHMAARGGEYGDPDDGQMYSDSGALIVGDEVWWYIYCESQDHGYDKHPNYAGAYSTYLKWRLNGFASMDFSANGTLTTEQFTLMGSEIHVNAVGNLTVELLDAKGAVVATGKFSGDDVDGVVTWDKSIASQAGKVVSLRFTSSDAKLYTVQICGSIFTDVAEDDWYYRAAHYAADNGIMAGTGNGKFSPNSTLTRAMVVQMLYNKVGTPKVAGKHGFNDVPADQWFNNAVTWGTKNGVMAGYGGGKFGPNDNVTIEQIAVILWNYSGNPEFDAELYGVGNYSGWAKNALTWAVDNGILYGANFKNATDNATRAQAAQMLTNFLRW